MSNKANNRITTAGAVIESTPLLGIPVLLGPEIKVPDYTPDQAELWIDHECPMYTGIIAAVNGIAFKRHGCFIDRLTDAEKAACFDDAGKIGLAWFEMPNTSPHGRAVARTVQAGLGSES